MDDQMIIKYIHSLIRDIHYSRDVDGVIIAQIPNMQGYYAQGESHEEARDNLIDVIEMLIIDKIKSGEQEIIDILHSYAVDHNDTVYA